jgi:hypothetical protein
LPPARLFATYGTIRDDDDSGAEWTRRFLVGLVPPARSATVRGFAMWRNKRDNWPWALRTDVDTDFIRVRLLGFSAPTDPRAVADAKFARKLAEADEIEQYTPGGGGGAAEGLYDRTVVTAELDPDADAGADAGADADKGGSGSGSGSDSAIPGADDSSDSWVDVGAAAAAGVFYFVHALPPSTEGGTCGDRFVDGSGLVWKRDRGGDWLRRDRRPEWFDDDSCDGDATPVTTAGAGSAGAGAK